MPDCLSNPSNSAKSEICSHCTSSYSICTFPSSLPSASSLLLGFTLLREDSIILLRILPLPLPLLLPLTTISRLFTADLAATLTAAILNILGIPANALLSVRSRFLYSEPLDIIAIFFSILFQFPTCFEDAANFPIQIRTTQSVVRPSSAAMQALVYVHSDTPLTEFI